MQQTYLKLNATANLKPDQNVVTITETIASIVVVFTFFAIAMYANTKIKSKKWAMVVGGISSFFQIFCVYLACDYIKTIISQITANKKPHKSTKKPKLKYNKTSPSIKHQNQSTQQLWGLFFNIMFGCILIGTASYCMSKLGLHSIKDAATNPIAIHCLCAIFGVLSETYQSSVEKYDSYTTSQQLANKTENLLQHQNPLIHSDGSIPNDNQPRLQKD